MEGQFDNQARAIDALRVDVAELRAETAGVRADMASRSDIGDLRREMADLRREVADVRNDMNRRFEIIDAKIDRHFVWLMGIMVTGFVGVIGALVGVVYR